MDTSQEASKSEPSTCSTPPPDTGPTRGTSWEMLGAAPADRAVRKSTCSGAASDRPSRLSRVWATVRRIAASAGSGAVSGNTTVLSACCASPACRVPATTWPFAVNWNASRADVGSTVEENTTVREGRSTGTTSPCATLALTTDRSVPGPKSTDHAPESLRWRRLTTRPPGVSTAAYVLPGWAPVT
ncbi:hypothetical protein COSO111634_23460 [Corallococcus soli]